MTLHLSKTKGGKKEKGQGGGGGGVQIDPEKEFLLNERTLASIQASTAPGDIC